jgi:hypothetical protein
VGLAGGKYIGRALGASTEAEDCREGTDAGWGV